MNSKLNKFWTILIVLLGVAVVAAMTVTWSAWAGNNEGKTPRPIGPLPKVTDPFDNPTTPEKAKLGELLFFEQRLSGDGSTPCSKCHDPKAGWGTTDDLSIGYPGTQHFRNSHTVLNNGHLKKFFWEGRATSLEAQAGGAEWVDQPSVVDGKIITAQTWESHPEFYRNIFENLDV